MEKMKREQFERASKYLLELCIDALLQKTPGNKDDSFSWKNVFELAKYNNVESIAFYAIEKIKDHVDEDIFKQWSKCKDQVLLKMLQFKMERETIIDKLHQKNIATMNLKGSAIEELYPIFGMRSMSDNDILYGDLTNCYGSQKKVQHEVVEIMKSLHYSVESLKGNDDIFYKKPCFNFEMHHHLFSTVSPYYDYYQNPWQKANSDDGLTYRFSTEEEYIYLIIHGAKHYFNCGCGMRILCDLGVYLLNYPDLDFEYIEKQLKQFDLTAFENSLRSIVNKVINNSCLNKTEEKILYSLVSSGTYGNMLIGTRNGINRASQEIGKDGRFKYLKSRLIMNEAELKIRYPVLSKNKLLIKILPIIRIFSGLIKHPKRIWYEFKLIVNNKNKNVK